MNGNRRASTIRKRDAIYAMFCEAADAGLPAPLNREIAKRLHCSEGAISGLVVDLKNMGRIHSHVYRGGKWGEGRFRIVEIVASGKKTAAPNQEHSQLPSERQSGESAGGPRVVSALDPQADMRTPCETAAEPTTAPPLLSPGMRGSIAAASSRVRAQSSGEHTAFSAISDRRQDTDIERIRRINARLPKSIALPASWGCRFPLWGEEAPTHEFCAKPRIENSSYCPEHHARCHSGAKTEFAALTPEQQARRLEHGRKIKAAMARKRDIEARREQPQQGA